MLRTRVPSRRERLVDELSAAALELQALAQRLANGADLPTELRDHAEALARAGRVAALAAVTANGGRNPQTLILFYGQFLTTSPRIRDKLCALDESGFLPKANPEHSAQALAPRRVQASLSAAAPSTS